MGVGVGGKDTSRQRVTWTPFLASILPLSTLLYTKIDPYALVSIIMGVWACVGVGVSGKDTSRRRVRHGRLSLPSVVA